MNILVEPHKQILRKLTEFEVKFLLIGGYAVNLHGYVRATGDMDIWLKPDNENRKKFLALLKLEGFDDESLSQIGKTDFTKHAAFHIGEKPMQIEFLTIISGVTFDEAYAKKELMPFENTQVPFLNLEHLILSKLTSSRPKDKLDVEELQRVLRSKQSK
jgi:predicted nucleotidyltransferase